MSNQKFNIGDTVEIVDCVEGYDSYEEWMKKNASDYLGNFKILIFYFSFSISFEYSL